VAAQFGTVSVGMRSRPRVFGWAGVRAYRGADTAVQHDHFGGVILHRRNLHTPFCFGTYCSI
jgi:hypothetical protein